MKTYLVIVLFGLFVLFGSTAVAAHGSGYGGSYSGIPLTGGITVWGNSSGHVGYAGNLRLGFSSGYAPVPYYGHVHGPSCGYASPYGYGSGHHRGYRNGHNNRRHRNHNGRGHHGGQGGRRH
jgi:hypothetical protein